MEKQAKKWLHICCLRLKHIAIVFMLLSLLSACTKAIVVNTETGYVLNPKDGLVYKMKLDSTVCIYDKVRFKAKAVSKKRGFSRCHD